MVAFIYQNLLEQGGPSGPNVESAIDWFGEQTGRTLTRPAQVVRGTDSEQHTIPRFKKVLRQGRTEWGRMIMFQYDPKTKATLPYYDKFPLGFVIDVQPDNFLMLNMHYLPPPLRARMMDALWSYVPLTEGQEPPDTAKITMTRPYATLQRIRSLRWYKGCIKRYLNSNVQSRFVQVYPKEWNLALYLPMTRTFLGASKQVIWRDAARKGRGQK